MNKIKTVDELNKFILDNNLIIRALPEYIEYKYNYNGASEFNKNLYDEILKTNPDAKIINGYLEYKTKISTPDKRIMIAQVNNANENMVFVNWINQRFVSISEAINYYNKTKGEINND